MDEGSRPVEIPRFVPCIEVPASSTSAKSEMRSSEHLAGTHPNTFDYIFLLSLKKHEKAERSPSTALRPGAAASSAAPGTPGDSRDSGEARSPQGGPPAPCFISSKRALRHKTVSCWNLLYIELQILAVQVLMLLDFRIITETSGELGLSTCQDVRDSRSLCIGRHRPTSSDTSKAPLTANSTPPCKLRF